MKDNSPATHSSSANKLYKLGLGKPGAIRGFTASSWNFFSSNPLTVDFYVPIRFASGIFGDAFILAVILLLDLGDG